MKPGDKITAMQYDLNESRVCEILFIYQEDPQDPALDMIMYRYAGKEVLGWHYRVNRRFEVESRIEKAKT